MKESDFEQGLHVRAKTVSELGNKLAVRGFWQSCMHVTAKEIFSRYGFEREERARS